MLWTALWGVDPAGRYTYREPGFSGEMIVSKISGWPVPVWEAKIKTVNRTSSHTCELRAQGHTITGLARPYIDVTTAFVEHSGEGDDDLAKFGIKFLPDSANIIVKTKGDGCGVSGWFGGIWKKSSPLQAHASGF